MKSALGVDRVNTEQSSLPASDTVLPGNTTPPPMLVAASNEHLDGIDDEDVRDKATSGAKNEKKTPPKTRDLDDMMNSDLSKEAVLSGGTSVPAKKTSFGKTPGASGPSTSVDPNPTSSSSMPEDTSKQPPPHFLWEVE